MSKPEPQRDSYDVSKCRWLDCDNTRLLFNGYCPVHATDDEDSTEQSSEHNASSELAQSNSITKGE